MKLNNLQVGDTVVYSFKKVVYTGKIVKHNKNITTELINNENIFSYEVNKYYVVLDKLNMTSIIDDSNQEIVLIEVKRKERLLI
jgi:hypothetical protein